MCSCTADAKTVHRWEGIYLSFFFAISRRCEETSQVIAVPQDSYIASALTDERLESLSASKKADWSGAQRGAT